MQRHSQTFIIKSPGRQLSTGATKITTVSNWLIEDEDDRTEYTLADEDNNNNNVDLSEEEIERWGTIYTKLRTVSRKYILIFSKIY